MKTREDKLLSLLKTGKEYSAVEMLMNGVGSEGRKLISTLRRQGYNIKDRWKNVAGRRFKVYRLVEEYKQPEISHTELLEREPLKGSDLDKWNRTRYLLK